MLLYLVNVNLYVLNVTPYNYNDIVDVGITLFNNNIMVSSETVTSECCQDYISL